MSNVRKINSQQILSDTKSLLIKEYIGGKLELDNKKIDLFTLNLDNDNILKSQIDNNMDNKLKFIKDRHYMKILNYIDNIENKIYKLTSIFHGDDYKIIEEVVKQNPIFLNAIKEFNDIFEELIYLYENIPPLELIKNLKALDKRNIIDDIIGDDELLTDEQIKELDDLEKIPDIRRFTRSIESLYNNDYNRFKLMNKRTISEDKWKCIYCVWWLDLKINYHDKDDKIRFYKYIFPKLFEMYPIEDFVMMFHIDQEYFIREKKKKCKESDEENSDEKNSDEEDSDEYI